MAADLTATAAPSGAYAAHTWRSPSRVKRWLHARRFVDAARVLDAGPADTVLDYGCGDGHLLDLLRRRIPPDRLWGYEPTPAQHRQATERLAGTAVRVVADARALGDRSFSRIACLEVCEHLDDARLDELMRAVQRLLAPGGVAVFGVPIEIGLPGLAKNLFRAAVPRRKPYGGLTAGNVVRSLFGLAIDRIGGDLAPRDGYVNSHIGFDHRVLRRVLRERFRLLDAVCSPVPPLGPAWNNVVYFRVSQQGGGR